MGTYLVFQDVCRYGPPLNSHALFHIWSLFWSCWRKSVIFFFIPFLHAFYLLLENTLILKSTWWHFSPPPSFWKVGEEKKQIFYFNFCLNFWVDKLSLITLLKFGWKSSFLLLFLQCFSFIQPSSGICNVQLLVTFMEF